MASRSRQEAGIPYVVLTGNPNCGKTTVFNALTGLKARVGNYAGVTVERKEGRLQGVQEQIVVLDLPGTYSLSPQSLDEQISRDVLFQRVPEVPPPALVVVVVDASNLERNLYYATQVIELGYPTIVALNMVDVAEEIGLSVDAEQLSAALGAPVMPLVASRGEGVGELRRKIAESVKATRRVIPKSFCELPESFQGEIERIAQLLKLQFGQRQTSAEAEALLLISDENSARNAVYSDELRQALEESRRGIGARGGDWRGAAIEARYARVGAIQGAVVEQKDVGGENFSDKLDQVLTHKVWGMLVFLAVMALMFQSIFSFAELPMTLLEQGVEKVGEIVSGWVPPGALQSLLVDGVIAGVGAVVVFLPQICLLFLFIGLLEDTGYMARAAFLMDRMMSKVGLHGKSFIPLLSSFACAIPGVMATRTIENPKDRLVTILVAPLMSCSARLPVYTVLIAASIPDRKVAGFLSLPGLTLFSMYLLGIIAALGMAWLFKKVLLRGETPMLIMELPPYKKPVPAVILRHTWERAKIFLQRAGTVILGISIILWFLASYPKSGKIEEQYAQAKAAVESQAESPEKTATLAKLETEEAGEQLRNSFAGRVGHFIEPVIKPLGFDWKIGIGIVASFAAREVFVSTMSTVYNVGEVADNDDGTKTLATNLQEQRREDGRPVYTVPVVLSLLVFYVLALQCVSTIAVVRRETNSWKWPAFQWGYMTLLAWLGAFVVYRASIALGL